MSLTVAQPQPWPQTVFSVTDFGADGTGAKDDTAAIQAALAAAEKDGGGIVLLPRGRYRVTDTLTIPRFTVLRGEKTEWTCLFWPDMPKPPEALIKGTNSFSLEDLTLYCSNYTHCIMGDLGNQPDAGNVTLRRVRVRADRYRGHLKPEDVDRLFRDSLRYNQGDTVRLGGVNVVITDCDLYGSGRSLFLSRVRGGRVANNALYNGRHGWYCISGSDGLIFENNRIIGADLMSTGGGLNCLDGSSYSRNIYYAHNALSLMHGWDREAMTSDAGGGAYLGKAVSAGPSTLTLADDARWVNRDWRGAAVLVVDGKGRGQYRRVAKAAERTVEVDQPLAVPLDDTSVISITMLQEHYILARNDFSDAGIAIQFYGISVEHIIAGNRSTRAGGFQNIGKLYSGRYDQPPEKNFGHQPSWFCQFLDNEILEGSIYRSGANNAILSGDSVVGVYGWPPTKTWPWPYNVGTVVRGNKLLNNARIHLGGSQNDLPSMRDAVVENNTIADSDEGVRLDRATASVFVRGNRFTNVRQPLSGTGADKALITPAQRAEAERSRLRALARDLGIAEDPTDWPQVRQGIERLSKLPDGSAEATALADGVLEAALTAVAQRKDTLPFQTLAPLLDLQLSVARESTLPSVLQSGKGGAATLALSVAAPSASPTWTLAADVTPPAGWAVGSQQLSAQPKSAQVSIPLTVPAGAWGRHELPVTVRVGPPSAALRVPTSVTIGSGYLRDWMLIGPFANKTKTPLDISLHPPDDGIDLRAEYDGLAGKV
ncbi:MAG: hypothetical protein FJ272_12890, partial [Planctomycetes bacterium]|nr:hypothetical protein [Planctomycetota bacterium]